MNPGRCLRHPVAINHPPGYPIFIAPPSQWPRMPRALASSTSYMRSFLVSFAGIAPAFQRQLVQRSWIAVSALQFLGATTFLSYSTQTEPLFAALLVAATGMVWQAWDRPSFLRFTIVGFICGLALCTRRTALVLPVALAVLFVWDLFAAHRSRASLPLWRGAAVYFVFLVVLFPEVLATFLSGVEIDTYGETR